MIALRCSRKVSVCCTSVLVAWSLASCTEKDPGTPLPPPVTPVEAPKPVVDTKPVFKPGDQLELFVKEDQTLNGSYLVREGGYIVIPRAGRIQVAGLTREAAEPKVKDVLLKTQLKEASVIVERTAGPNNGPNGLAATGAGGEPVSRVLIYLTGSVAKPGGHAIPVQPGKVARVYETLLISGGLGKFSKVDKVEIFRFDGSGKRKRTVVDLKPIMRGEAEDPPISEGDIINVPEKVFGF